jgi:hypothetical protein
LQAIARLRIEGRHEGDDITAITAEFIEAAPLNQCVLENIRVVSTEIAVEVEGDRLGTVRRGNDLVCARDLRVRRRICEMTVANELVSRGRLLKASQIPSKLDLCCGRIG